jgi:anti-sigma B factor antagonist
MSHVPRLFPREIVNGYCVISIDGDIDLAIAGLLTVDLEDAIEECSPHLLVDLSKVTFMDSTALSALVTAHRHAIGVGGSVRLVGPDSRISQLLAITNLDHVFPVHDTVESACAQDPT